MSLARVLAVLEDFRDGVHGESELRAVATFVLDALEGDDGDDDPRDVARWLCRSLKEAAETVGKAVAQAAGHTGKWDG